MPLEEEAASIAATNAEKRPRSATSFRLAGSGGALSGINKGGNTTVRFEGNSFAVTAHD